MPAEYHIAELFGFGSVNYCYHNVETPLSNGYCQPVLEFGGRFESQKNDSYLLHSESLKSEHRSNKHLVSNRYYYHNLYPWVCKSTDVGSIYQYLWHIKGARPSGGSNLFIDGFLQPPEETSSAAENIRIGVRSDIFAALSAALADRVTGLARKDIGVLGNFANDLNSERKLLSRLKDISQRISRNYNLLLLASQINEKLGTSPRQCAQNLEKLSIDQAYDWASFWAYQLREAPPAKPRNLVEFGRSLNPSLKISNDVFVNDLEKNKAELHKAAQSCLPNSTENIFVSHQLEKLKNMKKLYSDKDKSIWDKFIDFVQ